MAYGIESMLGSEFFVYILPWLLTFAIVYGLLEHYNLPKSKSARSIIGLVIAFLVLPAAPFISGVLQSLVGGFIVLVAGLLVLVILAEVIGIKKPIIAHDKDGKASVVGEENIFQRHSTGFGVIIILLAILVFIGAGGLELLGWDIIITPGMYPLLFFLGVMVLAIWWMTTGEK